MTPTGINRIPRAPDSQINYAQPWTYSNERDVFGSVRGEYDISANVTAWVAAGARHGYEANALAGFNLTNALTGAGTESRFDNTREDRTRTAEAGMRGKFRTGSVGHEVVGALSYYQLEKDNAYGMSLGNNLNTNIYAPRSHLPTRLTYLGNSLDDPALNGKTRMRSFAIGDTLSMLDDKLKLTLGLRHQTLGTEDISYRIISGGRVTSPGGTRSSYEESRTSPMAGVVFKPRNDLSIYANYIEGLSKGETAPARQSNNLPVVNAGAQLRPYVSKQKEIGVKYDGGRIGGGVAFFSTDKPRSLINGAGEFVAAGKDRHQGLELTAFGEITKGLRVLGGATLLDATQDSTGSAATDGKRVIGVPKAQGSIGLDWDVPGVQGLSLNGRVVASGHSYADATNTLRVPGWSRLDLGVRYITEVAGKLVTLRARVENAGDRNHWSSVGGYPGSGYLVLSTPRTYTLSASLDF